MRPGISIRGHEAKDTARAVEIAVAAWEPIHASFLQMMGPELHEAACANWRVSKGDQVRAACQGKHGSMVAVAEKGGTVVGFITFHADHATRIGTIGNNAVDPAHQGMGIGTAMYEYVFDRLRDAGMRFVRVSTGGDPGHAPARRAYEKAGFTIRIPKVDYYRPL